MTLLARHTVRVSPLDYARAVRVIAPQRPVTGGPTVLPQIGRTHEGWLRVRLPGRPNGATGWIRAQDTTVSTTRWRLTVDLSQRRVRAFEGGRLAASFRAVVGKPATPTPTGRFFVEEPVRLGARDVGAPFALALSARSDVLQEFDGGPGQIALHGLTHIGGVLGTATSHGCIRLTAGAMRWLVGRIDAGASVTIRA